MIGDHVAAASLQQYLIAGEKILWVGRPGSGIRFRPRDWFLVPFSFLWCGFAIFWELGVLRSGGPGFFLVFGAAFVAIGLFISIGRFFLDVIVRQWQTYAVTDNRLIVKGGWPKTAFQSFDLRNLPNVSLNLGNGQEGSISFGPGMNFSSLSSSGWGLWFPAIQGTSFEFIPDVAKVYNLILTAQKETSG